MCDMSVHVRFTFSGRDFVFHILQDSKQALLGIFRQMLGDVVNQFLILPALPQQDTLKISFPSTHVEPFVIRQA